MRVLVPGLVSVIVGLLLLRSTGASHRFFPTVFFAYFAIGLGIGNAFMPLLQIAMADVPAQDAGLGSGIVNVSQQVAGALGLAVLGTVATNHSKTLLAQHHTVADSLLGGYHLAFGIGVVAVIAAIATAVARPAHPGVRGDRGARRLGGARHRGAGSCLRAAGRMMTTTSTFPRRRPGAPRPHEAKHPEPPSAAPAPQGEGTAAGRGGAHGSRRHRGRPLAAPHRPGQPAGADRAAAMTA